MRGNNVIAVAGSAGYRQPIRNGSCHLSACALVTGAARSMRVLGTGNFRGVTIHTGGVGCSNVVVWRRLMLGRAMTISTGAGHPGGDGSNNQCVGALVTGGAGSVRGFRISHLGSVTIGTGQATR